MVILHEFFMILLGLVGKALVFDGFHLLNAAATLAGGRAQHGKQPEERHVARAFAWSLEPSCEDMQRRCSSGQRAGAIGRHRGRAAQTSARCRVHNGPRSPDFKRRSL